ncbi:hypothetical protein M514_09113 [Trichuris suis]|uniref:Uncharacterized protein n=1 Tax=Trichuris suis TaxID=68888 RepID=A0A085N5K7_9BILA|nr:hypothetical protein M513_09113 [Trichuris suis]KFD64753.1 hypothetical protein M514_09113 [Trichuris suis]
MLSRMDGNDRVVQRSSRNLASSRHLRRRAKEASARFHPFSIGRINVATQNFQTTFIPAVDHHTKIWSFERGGDNSFNAPGKSVVCQPIVVGNLICLPSEMQSIKEPAIKSNAKGRDCKSL